MTRSRWMPPWPQWREWSPANSSLTTSIDGKEPARGPALSFSDPRLRVAHRVDDANAEQRQRADGDPNGWRAQLVRPDGQCCDQNHPTDKRQIEPVHGNILRHQGG